MTDRGGGNERGAGERDEGGKGVIFCLFLAFPPSSFSPLIGTERGETMKEIDWEPLELYLELQQHYAENLLDDIATMRDIIDRLKRVGCDEDISNICVDNSVESVESAAKSDDFAAFAAPRL